MVGEAQVVVGAKVEKPPIAMPFQRHVGVLSYHRGAKKCLAFYSIPFHSILPHSTRQPNSESEAKSL